MESIKAHLLTLLDEVTQTLELAKKVKVNDNIKLESENGLIKEVKVLGLSENYVANEIFISNDYYKKIFNASIANNTILIKANNSNDTKLFQEELLKINAS